MIQIIALLSNLKQFTDVKILCILNMHLSSVDMWYMYSRYFAEIFIINRTVLSQFVYNVAKVCTTPIGEIAANLNRFIEFS